LGDFFVNKVKLIKINEIIYW